MTHFSCVFACAHPMRRLFVIAPYSLVLPGEIEARLDEIAHHSAPSGWNDDQLDLKKKKKKHTICTAFKSIHWDRKGCSRPLLSWRHFLKCTRGQRLKPDWKRPQGEHTRPALATLKARRSNHGKAQHWHQVVIPLHGHALYRVKYKA